MSEALGLREPLPVPVIPEAPQEGVTRQPTVLLTRKKSSVVPGGKSIYDKEGAKPLQLQSLSTADVKQILGQIIAPITPAGLVGRKTSSNVSQVPARQSNSPGCGSPKNKATADPTESTLYDYFKVKQLKTLKQKQQHYTRIVNKLIRRTAGERKKRAAEVF